MKRTNKAIAAVAGITAALLLAGYGLFHGYFDQGHFEIKKAQWSSPRQVAIVAERFDDDALGGLAYFVIVGNHLLSDSELRHTYYSDAVIFDAAAPCVDVRWDSPSKLVVSCNGSTIDLGHINAQKRQSEGITISYEHIVMK